MYQDNIKTKLIDAAPQFNQPLKGINMDLASLRLTSEIFVKRHT
jgi:hypothetical protein